METQIGGQPTAAQIQITTCLLLVLSAPALRNGLARKEADEDYKARSEKPVNQCGGTFAGQLIWMRWYDRRLLAASHPERANLQLKCSAPPAQAPLHILHCEHHDQCGCRYFLIRISYSRSILT